MIKLISKGLLDSNTYVVYNSSKKAMVVDCGSPVAEVKKFIESENMTVVYIVLTHGHFDHAHYIDEYAGAFPDAEIICHSDELKVLYDPDANLSAFISQGRCYDHPYKAVVDGDILTLDSQDEDDVISLKIIHSPGHTPGSICLLSEKMGVMLTGDVLFANGYGRVDFKYGSMADMRRSLKAILSLDGSIIFYPGHGESSKIKDER
ncbi:MAG: MBL fold metallo-hydrolase [Clostridia bacterium]|nr:MBL fold metallo-hydrolase [Clostridia bacterium]